ncbi:hypothetical protein PTTG_27869 [Puccinia triticina 1-1 BBBD Race 1]|uniref:Uncharacterized protein n=1 Tax=Puccinia triticina (isolate 1-1 / race 1 (BBBD)) TaxID=630390 RepID=A0A180GGZ1_PUCT1|nr:hypothetical protein PTTG_27869 [Puccinia triticina 1-1 BBBD Race 1]
MVTNPKDPAPTEDTTHNTPTINTLTFKRKEQDLTTIGGTRVNTVFGGVNFNWGNRNSHEDVGFTPYFEKNITKLKGPLPLTIFNKAWQDAALSYHAKKHPKSDDNSTEKGMRYTGYPYPSKWTMSFSDWTLNYAEFHDGFMVALRYNTRVQSNAFAHRVVKNGVSSFPDISEYQPEVYDTAYREAKQFRDTNPYAVGGTRAGWVPHSGNRPSGRNQQPASSQKSLTSAASTNSVTPSTNSTNTSNTNNNHTGAVNRPRGPRVLGYQGKNFNPNFVNHRAIRNNNQQQSGSGSGP